MKKLKKGINAEKWGYLFDARIRRVSVRRYSGELQLDWEQTVPELRQWRYFIRHIPISGAAPKNFISVYDHAAGTRYNPLSWPSYIAKVGHKLYPSESITEQLLTVIGEQLGLGMAKSRLMICDSQVRFLSRYFLLKDEILVHAADIIGQYLADAEFVAAVGQERLERDLFTFQVFCGALKARFPIQADEILVDFVRVIGFDALVGNQDRHLFNWGVIVHLKGDRSPRFSPIYDSARGLLWNESDDRLARFETDQALRDYVEKAAPLVGWDGEADLNHFDLVERISQYDPAYHKVLSRLVAPGNLQRVISVLDQQFGVLMSAKRRNVIERCLRIRFQRFGDVLGVRT